VDHDRGFSDSLLSRTPDQARQLVAGHTRTLGTERVALSAAAFRYAAETVCAEQAYPWFSFSAMDGFAVRAADLEHAADDSPVSLPVDGEIRAGSAECLSLATGNTIKIMTGAPLTAGADAVVMKEIVTVDCDRAVFRAAVQQWTAINRAGEEIQPGRVLVEAGTRLTPPSLGLLAALGVAEVAVHARPRVCVLTTGDELVAAGEPRDLGQIFDSISPMLAVALGAWGAGKDLRFGLELMN
jgi:molybdopterin molybdotransferase